MNPQMSTHRWIILILVLNIIWTLIIIAYIVDRSNLLESAVKSEIQAEMLDLKVTLDKKFEDLVIDHQSLERAIKWWERQED